METNIHLLGPAKIQFFFLLIQILNIFFKKGGYYFAVFFMFLFAFLEFNNRKIVILTFFSQKLKIFYYI